MEDFITQSATTLAAGIRQGAFTSREVVAAHIEVIKRLNPVINAMVCDRFQLALAEAEQADMLVRDRAADTLPPFHGVPCTIKESFALTGMPNTSGLVARKGILSTADAPTVSRIRAAGAIPLGVTNISELCMWMESDNAVYGRSNNPYNPAHIVGGSSGGEGAIIGAGASPFGLGSDIGGSIRMPAFFNGIFGHKPSGGLIPNTGQYPMAFNEALRYVTTGPLTRRAEDLWPLIRLLAGPDGQDTACLNFELGHPATVDISRLKIFVIEDNGFDRVNKDMIAALYKAAQALQARGAEVRKISIQALKQSLFIWSAMLSAAGGPSFSEMLGNGSAIPAWKELWQWFRSRSDHTLPAIGLALLEKIPALLPDTADRYIEQGQHLKQEVADLLGDEGLILYPSYPEVAPRHNKPLFPPFKWVYTAIWNVLQMPVTQVPLGLNRRGLPLGLQVVGGYGQDHLTVAVAMELENLFGGWVCPGLTRQAFPLTSG